VLEKHDQLQADRGGEVVEPGQQRVRRAWGDDGVAWQVLVRDRVVQFEEILAVAEERA